MKFGKLSNIEKVDFSIPKQPEENSKVFNKKFKTKIYIGAPGWGRPDWIGKIYPKGTKAKDFLYTYSRVFNSIELNTTAYRSPSLQQVEDWYKQAPDGFKFVPKIPQSISHYGGLGNNKKVNDFADAVKIFNNKLGITFLQLSENFSLNRFPEIDTFVKLWPKELPLAIEFRHESWFNSDHNVFNWLEKESISSVISDVAGRRDVLHMRLTNSKVMVRFTGNDMHRTDYERLEEWAKIVADWTKKGLEEIYFFLHEPEETMAPEAADHFIDHLNKNGVKDVERIKFVKEPEKEQVSLI